MSDPTDKLDPCTTCVWGEYAALTIARHESTIETLQSQLTSLREALDLALIGGNHLAHVLIGKLGAGFAEKYPPDEDPTIVLHSLCATDTYDVWCCWAALMNARQALSNIREQAK